VPAMQSGVFWGYIGLIDGLVKRIREEDGRDFTVIGTGGVASLFAGASETIQHFDPNLTIRGLLEIWKLNKLNG
jgi:type III pantothenate kinase